MSEAGEAVLKIKKLNPSAIEIMDRVSLDVIIKSSNLNIPSEAQAALLIEFSEESKDLVKEKASQFKNLFRENDYQLAASLEIEIDDSKIQKKYGLSGNPFSPIYAIIKRG